MKRQLIGLGVAALMFGGVGSANATLSVFSDGVIWDDDADQYWMQDLSYFTGKNYVDQIEGISLMNDSAFEGGKYDSPNTWENWHMATLSDMESLWNYDANEISLEFSPTYQVGLASYKGRFNEAYTTYHSTGHHVATVNELLVGVVKYDLLAGTALDGASPYLGAWVVADAVAPVPEPATMLLFGTGLVGLAGSRLRRKKK